jgi:hypothetical protein
MLGTSGRVLVLLAFVAAAVAAENASARTLRRACRDGLIAQRTDHAGLLAMSCDVDGQCDGVCSFELPVCGTSACQAGTFPVPVGSTRRERIAVEPGAAPTKVVLRCRPTPRSIPCATVTTTTDGPTTTSPAHQRGPTTTTRVRLIHPETTSSTTTTTSTSFTILTSTTARTLPVPCQRDADCDGLATACAVSFCGISETCVQTCVCVTPELDRTCSLVDATPCLTPADCAGPDDAACVVCYLNLCVTDPAPACFSSPT